MNEADVDVNYKKTDEGRKIIITLSSEESMTILDILTALSSIMTGILTSGKY